MTADKIADNSISLLKLEFDVQALAATSSILSSWGTGTFDYEFGRTIQTSASLKAHKTTFSGQQGAVDRNGGDIYIKPGKSGSGRVCALFLSARVFVRI